MNLIRILRVMVLAALILSFAPAFAGAQNVPSREYLFNSPAKLESGGNSIRVGGTIDPSRTDFGNQAWTIVAPPGEYELVFHELQLADMKTGEIETISDPAALEDIKANYQFKTAFSVEEMGIYRHVRLIAIRVNGRTRITREGNAYTVEGFDIELRFSPQSSSQQANDSGFAPDSSFRRMLELAVANPEDIERFAIAEPEMHNRDGVRPSDWQPRPEFSPGFPWLKIPVKQNGAFVIDGRWLGENGVDPSSISPNSLILMESGREVAMLKLGPKDASFSTGARLMFYGLKNDSRESAERIYFLGRRPEGSARAEFTRAEPLSGEVNELLTYNRRMRFEEDYSLQTRIGNFLSIREMTWVWQHLEPEQTFRFEFITDGLIEPVPQATAMVDLYNSGRNIPGQATLSVVLNGKEIEKGMLLSATGEEVPLKIPPGLLRHDRNIMELTLHVPERFRHGSAPLFFDGLEVTFESMLKAYPTRHLADFSRDDSITTGSSRIQALGFRPYHLLPIDITDPENPVRLPVEESNGVAWISARLEPDSRLLLTEDDALPRAPDARPSVWQNWRDLDHSADLLFVYHALFAEQATNLAEDIRATGKEVELVDVESLYEAYSHGELTAGAIQLFVRDAVYHWKGRRPGYLLLLGDSTSDGQNRARNDVVNYVPTYSVRQTESSAMDEYASDQYFAWLGGADQAADIIVGRISAANVPDAREMVNKAITYRQLEPEPWNGRLFTVTDPDEFYDLTRRIRKATLTEGFEERTLNIGEYPWEDNFYLPPEVLEGSEVKVSPVATNMIESAVEAGQLIVTFIGHGSPNIWSNQRIWFGGDSKNSDNLRLDNGGKLPFLLSLTCNNGAIDYPVERWNICITEDMMRVPNGGYVGMFVPSGPGFSRNHLRLAEGFFQSLGRLGVNEFGMLAELTRIKYQGVIGSDDHSRMYILLGDPTLEMPLLRRDLEIEVTPDVLPAENGLQEIEVRLDADEELAAGTVLLKNVHDETVASIELDRQADGSLKGALVAEVAKDEFDFAIVARATNADGELYQTGRHLHRRPANLVFTTYEQQPVTSENSREVTYYIRNRSGFSQEAAVELTITRDTGREPVGRKEVNIPANEMTSVHFTVEGEPGVYLLEAHLSPSHPRTADVSLPSSVSYEGVVIGSSEGATDLAVAPNTFRLLPARARTSSPIAETFVANLGTGNPMCTMNWKIEYPDGGIVEGSKTIGTVKSGTVLRAQIPMRMELLMRTDIKVQITGEIGEGEETNFDNNRLVSVLRAEDASDLRIVRDSIDVLPDHLAEGLTVFVDGYVENVGEKASYGSVVRMFASDDESFGNPLRTLAGQLHNEIPPLDPGEQWPFRVRWDPVDNLDIGEVVLVADAEQTLVESDKANNVLRIPIDVKSKWDLSARGMGIQPGQKPGTVYLIAAVENTGETDAQYVSVWFYSDASQSDENYLGEVLVPRIPAKTLVELPFEWNLQGVDLQKKRNPSFSMALKGSLQRTSSISE